MSTEPSGSATFGTLLSGYAAALDRFQKAAAAKNELPLYWALFETLNWAVTIDDAVGAWWAPEGDPLGREWRERVKGAEAMDGIRYARNRVHHQWALAVDVKGLTFPMRFPARFFEVLWRPVDELPPPDEKRPDERGRASYERLLAGQMGDMTLHVLGEAFDKLWHFLELPGSPSAPAGLPRQASAGT